MICSFQQLRVAPSERTSMGLERSAMLATSPSIHCQAIRRAGDVSEEPQTLWR
jgi:hypothetical protein